MDDIDDFDLNDLPGELLNDEEIAFALGQYCPKCFSLALECLPDFGLHSPDGFYCPACGWQSIQDVAICL